MKTLLKVTGALLAIIILALLFLPAPIIKWAIETHGSQHLQARVDVGDVDFSWLDRRLTIYELAATNPHKPLRNLVELDKVSAQLDVMPLLNQQVFLDEVLIHGIVVDGERANSGAIAGLTPVADQPQDGGLSLPGMALPDVDALVQQEKALYQQKVDDYEAKLQQQKQQWQQLIDELPDKDALKQYEQRWNDLKQKSKGGDFLAKMSLVNDLNALRDDIRNEAKKFKQAQNQLSTEYTQLQRQFNALKAIPSQSLNDIMASAGLQGSVAANIGDKWVSGTVQQWFQQGVAFYQMMAASEGATTTPAVVQSAPQLLIKRLKLSGPFTHDGRSGTVDGEINNISDMPALIADPLTADIKASGQALGAITLNALIDHRTAGQESDSISLKVVDSALSNFSLAQSKELNVALKKALLNLSASASLQKLTDLNLSLNSLFKDVAFDIAGQQAETPVAKALLAGISQLSQVIIDGDAVGSLQNPQLKIRTNLNDVFKNALGSVIQNQSGEFRQQLQGRLDEQLSATLGPVEQELGDLKSMQGIVGDQEQQFSDLLGGLKL